MLLELKRPQSTRDRIGAGALALFNARGVAHVTTAEIAASAGIREGNLHYHFARKGQLIEALYDQFEQAAMALASRPLEAPSMPGSYRRHQRAWFDLMWDYRCFYRDAKEVVILAPALRERFADLGAQTQSLTRRIFETAVALGLMRIEPDALTRLLDNVWIVSSYWMSYRMQAGAEVDAAALDWGFDQVSALIAPYIVVFERVIPAQNAITPGEDRR